MPVSRAPKTPADLARRLAGRGPDESVGTWRRESYRLPRSEAHATARDWFERYPRTAYTTEVESWRVLENGLVEFTMRRMPGKK